MPDFASLAKGGWHPEKGGGGGSSSGKSEGKFGKVTGYLPGQKQKENVKRIEDAQNHRSAPLSSLKDPDSFAPPPRHTGVYGAAAERSPVSPSSHSHAPPTPARAPPAQAHASLGAPLSREYLQQQTREQQEAEYEAQRRAEEEVARPPEPYRVDTTGLATTNLPKPPVRRMDGTGSPVASSPKRPTPGLPPRLPARQNSNPSEFAPAPPPTYNEATVASPPTPQRQTGMPSLNTASLNRLGQAGVNVPDLGIGQNRPATPPRSPASAQQTQSPSRLPAQASQLGELQSRFAKMNAGGEGQAASPTRTAMAAANTPAGRGLAASAMAAAKKPAPPPPPPKKAALAGHSVEDAGAAPPPLPMSSKPRPS